MLLLAPGGAQAATTTTAFGDIEAFNVPSTDTIRGISSNPSSGGLSVLSSTTAITFDSSGNQVQTFTYSVNRYTSSSTPSSSFVAGTGVDIAFVSRSNIMSDIAVSENDHTFIVASEDLNAPAPCRVQHHAPDGTLIGNLASSQAGAGWCPQLVRARNGIVWVAFTQAGTTAIRFEAFSATSGLPTGQVVVVPAGTSNGQFSEALEDFEIAASDGSLITSSPRSISAFSVINNLQRFASDGTFLATANFSGNDPPRIAIDARDDFIYTQGVVFDLSLTNAPISYNAGDSWTARAGQTFSPSGGLYSWQRTTLTQQGFLTLTTVPADNSGFDAQFQFTAPASLTNDAGLTCRLDGVQVSCNNRTVNATGLAPGSHFFDVRGSVYNPAHPVARASHSWTVSALAPPQVVIDAASKPSNPTTSTTASFTWDDSAGGAVETTHCQLDFGGYQPCSEPFTASGLAEGFHTFDVQVGNAAGFATDSYSWEIIAAAPPPPPPVSPPTVTITSKPDNPTTQTFAYFDWQTTGAPDTFECKLDAGSYQPCDSPTFQTYSNLAIGNHSFEVRVANASGSDSATYDWLIQAETVTVTIISKPPNPSSDSSAYFDWQTTGNVQSTECKLDGGAYQLCFFAQYSDLAPGQHTFTVRANGAGGISATDSWNWEVLAPPPPTVTITTKPDNPTSSTFAYFDWQTSSNVQSTECRLDGAAYQPCFFGQSYFALAPGQHTFTVRANGTGGLSATDSWTWEVLAPPPPTVTITSKPPNPSAASSASFQWQTTGNVQSTDCKLDGGAYQPCFSGQSYFRLAPGQHTFTVRANGSGGISATDSYNWEVLAPPPPPPPPTVTIISKPDNPTSSRDARFEWQTTGAPDTFRCKLDTGFFQPCGSPSFQNYSGLALGTHTFVVRVFSFATRTGSQDSFSWTIEEAAPPPPPPPAAPTVVIDESSKPASPTTDTSAALTWTEGGGQVDTRSCEFDGQPAACVEPFERADLSIGSHTFSITVQNVTASDTAAYSWEVAAPPPPPARCEDVRVSSIAPTSVMAGESIQVTGSNLEPTTGLTLNKAALEIQSKSASSLMALIPEGATSGQVKLVCDGEEQDVGDPLIVVNPNLPPVPNATGTATAKHSRSFVLDGSLSFDLDGSIMAYKWSYRGKTFSNKATMRYTLPNDRPRTVRLTVTDNRGATDSRDLRLAPLAKPAPINITLPSARFCFDCSTLSRQAKRVIKKARLLARDARAVTIFAHTDSVGTRTYNQRLSRRRVINTRVYLIRGMIPENRPSKVNTKWFGEMRPVASNRTVRGRSLNRRSTITIYP